jgi:hypothetical protein
MTFREIHVRIMSRYWSSALFLGGLLTLGMIASDWVIPPADGPSVSSIIGNVIGGVIFGLVMAAWNKREREKAIAKAAAEDESR